jgi:dephospho-CoA kinase
MFIVGLTGGLGTGKSSVAGIFKKLGASVIDADEIVHEGMKAKGVLLRPIAHRFSKDILDKGGINRKKLAGIVFNDSAQLRKLEKIVHPVVQKSIKKKLSQFKKSKKIKVVILNIPLLFESNAYPWVDTTIVVSAARVIQIKRACRRLKMTRSEALARIKRQMSLSQKIRLADIIIDNNGSMAQTQKQVKAIWQRWLSRGQI